MSHSKCRGCCYPSCCCCCCHSLLLFTVSGETRKSTDTVSLTSANKQQQLPAMICASRVRLSTAFESQWQIDRLDSQTQRRRRSGGRGGGGGEDDEHVGRIAVVVVVAAAECLAPRRVFCPVHSRLQSAFAISTGACYSSDSGSSALSTSATDACLLPTACCDLHCCPKHTELKLKPPKH